MKLRDFYLFNFFSRLCTLSYDTVHLVRFDQSEISLLLLPFSIEWVLVAAAVVKIFIIAFAIAIVLPFRYADASTGPQDTFIRATFHTYVGVTPVRCRWLVSGVSWARRQMHTTRGRYLPTYREDARRHHFLFVVCGSVVFSHEARNLAKLVLSYLYIEMRREQVTRMYLSSNTKRAQLARLEIKSGWISVTKQKQNKFLQSFIRNVHYFIRWLLS